jgi:hypothetical protein
MAWKNFPTKFIETTPLNSVVLPINSSKKNERHQEHRHFTLKWNGGFPFITHQQLGLKTCVGHLEDTISPRLAPVSSLTKIKVKGKIPLHTLEI